MPYRTILVEDNPEMINAMIAELKNSTEFILTTTYQTVNDALGQSSIFRPDLFLIDVDSPEALEHIPVFVDIFPKAEILGLVSTWNSNIAQHVIESGALGCITKQFTKNDILSALDLYQKRGKKGLSRIISFFSPKGRAGRTTFAAILGILIAEHTDERVALIDADLQFGDMPIFFDIEPKHTIVDATQDVRLLTPLNFKPYFHRIKHHLYLLSSPDRPEYAELVEKESLLEVVRLTCNLFKYVLIDLPAGFNPLSIAINQLSDTVVIMAMLNSGFEIEHVRRTLEMTHQMGSADKRIYTVFSRVNPCTEEARLKLEDKLGYPISDILPNEYQTISLANSGRIVNGLPKDSMMLQTLKPIAEGIIKGTR